MSTDFRVIFSLKMLMHNCYLYSVILFLHFLSTSYAKIPQTRICWKPGNNDSINARANQSFADFIQSSGLWADKSLLIKTIMNETSKILIISSPQGWCKSLNLKMLQSFFDIEVDDDGERKPLNETFAYNYFQNCEIRLTNGITQEIYPFPLISTQQDIMKQALGQFPVIFLNFDKVLFDKELLFLRRELNGTFAPYVKVFDRIIDNNSTSSDLRIRAIRCKEIIFNSKRIAPEILLSSIHTLSEVLYTYYGQKVIILIDEYDQLVRDMYFDLWTTFNEEDEFLMKNFYEKFTQLTFYSNKYLEKAVIMTVLPIRTLLGFNRDNDVREYKIIDGDNIYNFFGFTIVEVFIMMRIRKIPDYQRDAVIKWCDGYYSPSSPSGFLFSPSSVVYFINDKIILDCHSTGSMLDEFMFEMRKYPVFRNTLISLINDTTYVMDYSKTEKLDDRHCSLMNTFVKNKTISLKKFKKEHCNIALALLCSMSYFTVDYTFANNGTNGTHIGIRIPNEEMQGKLSWKIDYKTSSEQSSDE